MTATIHQLHHSDADPRDTVTTTEILNAAHMTYRQLDHWCRTGYLQPLPRRREHSGYPREFSRDELAVAVLMSRFIDGGINPQIASFYARELLDTGTTQLGGIPLHLPEEL